MRIDVSRLWRVILWGVVTFILFSVLFWYGFRTYLTLLVAKRVTSVFALPGPLLPGILAGIFVLSLVGLERFVSWKLRPGRKFEDAGLCLRLLLLVLLLAMGVCLPRSSSINTCRCCLFTLDQVCERGSLRLPPKGAYRFSSYDGWHFGVYAQGEKEIFEAGKFWFDKFGVADVQVTRTRFGWPLHAITRDAISQEHEWHIVVEAYLAMNLLIGFLGWLCLQPVISFANWSFRLLISKRLQ